MTIRDPHKTPRRTVLFCAGSDLVFAPLNLDRNCFGAAGIYVPGRRWSDAKES